MVNSWAIYGHSCKSRSRGGVFDSDSPIRVIRAIDVTIQQMGIRANVRRDLQSRRSEYQDL